MKAILLIALLAATFLPIATAQAEEGGWSDPRPFRMTLHLDDPRDLLDGQVVTLESDQLVLIPLDVTSALRHGGTWPFDGAGRPLAWTFAPESLRVVAAGSDTTLAARFLTYSIETSTNPDYKSSTNAAGTLAVLLPAGTHELELYFDIAEHTPAPVALSPQARARLDDLGGLGPWVATLAHVPRTPAGEIPALVILAPDAPTRVKVQRIQPGAPPTLLADALVDTSATLDLPPTEQGYDISIIAERPIHALLRTAASAGGAFFHPSLDGTVAGERFLFNSPGAAHVIGTKAATSVSVTDARTGATISSFTVGRLAARVIEIPSERTLRLSASAPVLLIQQGSLADGVDAFLQVGRAINGQAHGPLVIAARGAGHAATAIEPATVQAFPLADPQAVTTARLGEDGQQAWISQSASPPTSAPWAFSSNTDLSILTGSDGYAPLAGAGGQDFLVAVAASRTLAQPADFPLMARVLAPFAQTSVEIEQRAFNGTQLASGAIEIGARVALTTVPGTDTDLVNEGSILRASASKPVFLSLFRPGAAALAPLPGLPAVMRPSSAELEHSGAILAWTPITSFHTARPGETTRIDLTLANLGRTKQGEGILENAAIEAHAAPTSRCPTQWEVSLPDARVDGLASPGQRVVSAYVLVPDDALAGECMELELTARSSFDPEVRTTARATVRSLSGFQPELRVLRPDGALSTTVAITIEPGVAAVTELRLRNVGGENGTAIIRHARGPGYESTISERIGGPPVERVEVPAGGETRLWLSTRAPTGAEPAWDFVVQATNAADPSARDEVIVSATPRADLSLYVSMVDRRFLIIPGGEAATWIDVANLGSDVELRARIATTLPEGWNASIAPDRFLLRAAGTRADLGARLDARELRVDVRAPSDARVGETFPLTIALEAGGRAVRVPMLALVANDLATVVKVPDQVIAGPREAGAAVVELRSEAPAVMNVTLRSLAGPRGWNVTTSETAFTIAPRETRRITLRYEVGAMAPAGPGAIAFALKMEDDVTPPRLLEVNVTTLTPERPVLNLSATTQRVILAPAERAAIVFHLRNDGNAPAALAVETTGPVALVTELPATLAPGGTLIVSANVGPGTGVVELTIGGRSASVDVVAATRDIRVLNATLRPQGAAWFLDVEVENGGSVGSAPLVLYLRVADAKLAEYTLPALALGGRAKHALVSPAPVPGLTVLIVTSDGLPDGAPEDNEWVLIGAEAVAPDGSAMAAARRAVPGISAPLIVLAALAALGRRRA